MRKSRKRKHKGLYGLVLNGKKSKMDSVKEGGLLVVAALAAGGAGAAIGKHSLIAGIPLTMFGVYKGNKYLTAAGLGMCMANGFQRIQGTATNGLENEMDGFDQVKERMTNYFRNFSEKLYLPQPQGEGMNGEEKPEYFLNPYTLQGNEVDMSQLDRVQEKVAMMSGFNDNQREF